VRLVFDTNVIVAALVSEGLCHEVVETHLPDQDAILSADHVVDIGPGAGEHGVHIVAQGTPEEVKNDARSLTGQYLSGRKSIAVPGARHRPDPKRWLRLERASGNNLKQVSLKLPVGLFTCVTGVSGSGKSTLVNDTLFRSVARHLYGSSTEAAPYEEIHGLEFFDKVVDVDQSPIGRTPRSNPATYTGLFTPIRELFAGVPESRARGYGPGR
jgi:excinuclease ABC subunit A